MSTKKDSARAVVDANPQPPPPPADDAPVASPKKESKKKSKKTVVFEFVKNLNPNQEIPLEGRERPFKFPSNPFHTSDTELAAQLREVAKQYHIFENEAEEA
jgi:hypothetical protein